MFLILIFQRHFVLATFWSLCHWYLMKFPNTHTHTYAPIQFTQTAACDHTTYAKMCIKHFLLCGAKFLFTQKFYRLGFFCTEEKTKSWLERKHTLFFHSAVAHLSLWSILMFCGRWHFSVHSPFACECVCMFFFFLWIHLICHLSNRYGIYLMYRDIAHTYVPPTVSST